jgi:hypothetical protein
LSFGSRYGTSSAAAPIDARGVEAMETDELRARAERYRLLRRQIGDEHTRNVLRDFVDELIARADELDAQLAATAAARRPPADARDTRP